MVGDAGQVVTREELQQKIWPGDVYVTFDQGLNNAIKKVRDALGDSAENPRFIETVAKRGYRFVAPVISIGEPSSETHSRGRSSIFWRTALVSTFTALLLTTLGYWAWHRSATDLPYLPTERF